MHVKGFPKYGDNKMSTYRLKGHDCLIKKLSSSKVVWISCHYFLASLIHWQANTPAFGVGASLPTECATFYLKSIKICELEANSRNLEAL